MRRLSVFATVVMLLFACMVWCSCKKEDAAKDQPSTSTAIKGIVKDENSAEPVGDVLLTLFPGGRNAYGDAAGAFMFEGVEAQQYTLTAQKSGYISNRKMLNVEAGQTLTVNMTISKQ